MNSCSTHVNHVESGARQILGRTPRRVFRARFENARAFSWQPADASRGLRTGDRAPFGRDRVALTAPVSSKSEVFQELDHQRDALRRLLELEEVGGPGHEVAIEAIERVEVEARPKR